MAKPTPQIRRSLCGTPIALLINLLCSCYSVAASSWDAREYNKVRTKSGSYYVLPTASLAEPLSIESARKAVQARAPSFSCVATEYKESTFYAGYSKITCENSKTGARWEPYNNLPEDYRVPIYCGRDCAREWVASSLFAILDNSDAFQVFDNPNRVEVRSDPFPITGGNSDKRFALGWATEHLFEPQDLKYRYSDLRLSRFDRFRGLHAPLRRRSDQDVAVADMVTVYQLTTYQILDQITNALGFSIPKEHLLIESDPQYQRAIRSLKPEAKQIRADAIARQKTLVLISVERESASLPNNQ